ncbi:IS5 family transposase, partial [Pilimelia anulata]|uniref:IS5 family transposase n=1 Tax=Pilimelia anulata TaxID=53371 RepID=UPI0035710EF3
DRMWVRLEPLLPDRSPQRGGRWSDHRLVIEAIAWKYRTGSPWRDVPEEFGSWKGAYSRFRRWTLDGTWQRLFTAVQADADTGGELDWLVAAVDSTVVRAHQHAAGLRPKGGHRRHEPADHALGRSRGGLSTKIHLAADARCRPLSLLVTAGQAGDAPQFEAVMNAIRVPRPGPGRPRQRPARVLADKAYSSKAIRGWLSRRGITATIPVPADQQANRLRRGSAGGRPPAFDKIAYRQRNVAERCINRLKQWRGLAMRTDKLAVHYQ